MHLEDLRTWHWVLIGLITGLLFGAVHRYAGPWFDSDDLLTLSDVALQQVVNGRMPPNPLYRRIAPQRPQGPVVKDLVIHPPVPNDPSHANWVTGKMYEIVIRPADPKNPASTPGYYEQWQPFKARAAIPYKAAVALRGTFPDFATYLARIQKTNLQLAYRYAWWEKPTWTMLLPTVAGLLIIGIAWPLLIVTLQGTGLSRPPKVKSAARPRSTAGGGAATAPRDNTAGDLQLAALNDQLETSLAAHARAHPVDSPINAPAGPAIAPLSGGEPVSAAVSAAMTEAAKEYGGEFYPVAKPGVARH